jgi:alkyl hydroperoxide reductase subunit D
MEALDRVREAMGPFAKDIQLNLSAVLQGGALDDAQRWAVAVACAVAVRNGALRDAVVQEAAARVGDAVLDDARAAASEACIQSHERAVIEGGLSEDHVHDAVRIAATIHAAAVALDA